MENLIDNEGVFILAGNALFTLKNADTGNRFTFKVKKAKKENEIDQDLFFVSLLNGSDNYSNYTYMGIIRNGEFKLTANSKVGETAQSYRAFKWVWDRISNLPENVEFYHEGRCGRCGRRLTVPESIESGYGPNCIIKI